MSVIVVMMDDKEGHKDRLSYKYGQRWVARLGEVVLVPKKDWDNGNELEMSSRKLNKNLGLGVEELVGREIEVKRGKTSGGKRVGSATMTRLVSNNGGSEPPSGKAWYGGG
ncbi:hypothetical protein L1887_19649 [Cichorium endivia]|nr:hypothetical protein L1887_19649 [Cichorium endivia]